MTTYAVSTSTSGARGGFDVVRVPREMAEQAVRVLFESSWGGDGYAAKCFVAGAAKSGVDLSLLWATVAQGSGARPRPRQVCLLVPGSGRTGMTFVSGRTRDDVTTSGAERIAVVTASLDHARRSLSREIRLSQGLPEPGDDAACDAFRGAGFASVGHLLYLRRDLTEDSRAAPMDWPSEIGLRSVMSLERGSSDRVALAEAMRNSYEGTLDCPELCGLRDIEDVIDSHRAVGEWRPGLWWVVMNGPHPAGCLLLNPSPEHDSVDLVYLGLGRGIRGQGFGGHLLTLGIHEASKIGLGSMTCAVDRRNDPALRLYARFGFTTWAERVAFVRPVDD